MHCQHPDCQWQPGGACQMMVTRLLMYLFWTVDIFQNKCVKSLFLFPFRAIIIRDLSTF